MANLGDSRCYRFAARELEQVSVDHSLVQQLVDAGQITRAEAASHPERHVVTRALGGPETAAADLFLVPLDGGAAAAALLRRHQRDDRRRRHRRRPARHRRPREAADRLVDEALHAGGRDNATAVVVDVVGGLR